MHPRCMITVSLSTCLLTAAAGADDAPQPKTPPADFEDEARSSREEQAVALHDEARALYDSGQYRDAIVLLERALELDPDGVELVYNLGLIHERLGELDVAERYYRRYVAMEDDPALKARGEGILRRIHGAAEKQAAPSSFDSAPVSAPDASRVWLIPAGVAAAGLVAGSVFGIAALARDPGDTPRTEGSTGVAELRSEADAAHTFAVVADLALIVGTVAAGVTIAVWAATRGETAVGVEIGPGSGAVRVVF